MPIDPMQGKAPVLPYDAMAVQEQLMRKKKLIEALSAKQFQSIDPAISTGKYMIPNFAGAFDKYWAGKQAEDKEKELKGEETTAAGEIATRTPVAMKDLIDSLTPQTKTDYTQMPNIGAQTGQGMAADPNVGSFEGMDATRPTVTKPADPIGGIGRAYASRLPGVTEMAQDLMKGIVKNKLEGGIPSQEKMLQLANHYTVPSILASIAHQDISLLKPKGDAIPINGKLVDKTGIEQGTGPATEVGNFEDKWVDAGVDPNTGLPLQRNPATGEVKGRSGATSPIPQTKLSSTLAENMGSDYVKSLSAGKKSSEDALTRLPVLQDASGLIDQANLGKPWAELELTARKAAKAFGWSDDEAAKISSPEAFTTAIGQEAIKILETMRPASDTDLKQAREMVGSSKTIDPRTAKILVSMTMSNHMNALLNHQMNVEKVDQLEKIPGMQGIGAAAKGIYYTQFGGPGSAFDNPEKYGVTFDPGSKRFKSSLLAAGGRAPVATSPQAVTPADEARYLELKKKFGGR